MRILYCNKYNFRFSGTEAYLFETMELMQARGHHVALFSMADERGGPTRYDHHFVAHKDFKSAGPARKARMAVDAIYSHEARKRIAGMIKEFKPDVAHVRNIYHHLSPSILWELKAQGISVLYHLNDFKLICPSYNLVASGNACEKCKGGKFWNVIREGCYAGGTLASAVLAAEAYFHRWISTYEKCVDLILTPSQFAKWKLVENGWASERIQVLPHFQECPAEGSPYPGASAPILYFGRLSAEKGIDDLLVTMKELPGIQLIIAGDGPQRPQLEFMARNLQLSNVTFVGHVSGAALDALIGKSQFTIFPSHAYETMGKSILESYAQGRAVVASDIGSRREMVTHGETGLLYRVKDVDQLSKAIVSLRDRPELAKRMGEAGRKIVQQRHSPQAHFAALEATYDNLIRGKKADVRSWPVGPSTKPHEPAIRIAFIGGRGVIRKYSGIETYYEEVGSRLAELGCEVTTYCRSYFTPAISDYRGIRIVRLPTIRSKHLETLVHTFLSTIHACFSRCEIVHYHTLGPSLFSVLPRMFGKKTIVTVQGLDWKRKKWGRFAQWALRGCEWTSARFPNKTVVVSRALQEYYRARYGRECAYVPNGTEIRARRNFGYLRKFGLGPRNYVLYLGRFSPEKNCHLLIEAFERLDTTMKLVLAGGSSHTDGYAASLQLHESNRIKFLDWLSGQALEEVLTNTAVFVLPSDMEGLSLALLDAMGAGVCVLASDVAENMEALGHTGFIFKGGDVRDLEKQLRRLLADPALRESAGQQEQRRVRQYYLWDGVASDTAMLYQTLTGRLRKEEETFRKAA